MGFALLSHFYQKRKLNMKFNEFQKSWNTFWLKPASARPLALLRIGTALILLAQAYWVAPQFFAIYGSNGILEGSLRGEFRNSDLLGLYELVVFMLRLGVGETTTLLVSASAYILGLFGLLLGYHTRKAACLTWLTHLLFAGAHVTSYGIDTFIGITLFYFLWMPIGAAYSLDVVSGRTSSEPTSQARWAFRVLQIQLSIAYLFCGIDKAMGIQWWNGDAIWRSVMMPLYAQFDLSWLSKLPWICKVAGWGTLVLEAGYPLGMAYSKTRKFWFLSIVGLHLGIFIFMGLHLFALMMILLSTSAFGLDSLAELSKNPSRIPFLAVDRRPKSAPSFFRYPAEFLPHALPRGEGFRF